MILPLPTLWHNNHFVTRCTSCGAALPEGARFCPACAASAQQAPAAYERKLATMLFADLVGSTAMASESDPEHVRLMLDRFYGGMAEEIRAVGGTLEKFAGDAVMAVFGAPAAYEDHSERALHAALSMQRRLGDLFGERLGLRVGVNSGEVVLGRPAEGSSFVSGDAVNVAARLEQAAAPGEILVGERTVAAVGGAFEFGSPQTVKAKGKAKGVRCRPLLRALLLTRPRGVAALPPAFVGRDRELTLLESTYRVAVESRRPKQLVIVGEAGVGKTRLTREFWRVLGNARPEPLRRVGRCIAYRRASAYEPLGDILKEQFGILASDGLDQVRRALGGREILALALGFDVAGDLPPLVVRERFNQAWADFLLEMVGDHPLVLLIEDLHWAEQPLLDFFESVIPQIHGPLFLLMTTRPEGVPPSGSDVLQLEALGNEEAERMLTELLGGAPPKRLAELAGHGAGNPFFIEELLSMLIDRNLLTRSSGEWTLGELPSDFVVPDTIHALLAARIDLLSAGEKAALQAGAISGRVFWEGSVGALLDEPRPELGALEQRGFIHPRRPSTLARQTEYVIKHALTREVAYNSIPKGRRARLHLAFGQWLERLGEGGDEHAAVLAHHYSEALRSDYSALAWPGDEETPLRLRPKAVGWLRRAAQLAIRRYELEKGLSLLLRAIEIAPDNQSGADLWREVGKANVLKFDGQAFWAAMERSLDLDNDPASRCETYSLLALETARHPGMWRRWPPGELVESWVEHTLRLARRDSVQRARALLARAYLHPEHGDEAAREASVLIARLGDSRLQLFGRITLAAAAFEAGRFEEACALSRQNIALLPGIDDPDLAGEIIELAIPAVAAMGGLDEARQLLGKAEDGPGTLSPHHRMHVVAQRLDIEELAGNWGVIRELTEVVEERVTANRATPCVRSARSLLLCAVAWTCADEDSRSRAIEEAAEELGMDGYRYAHDPPRLRLALLRGDRRRVQDLLKERIRRTYTMGAALIATRLDGLAALGDRERVEAEAVRYLRPGIYLEPFAQRALGIVRGDLALMKLAHASFREGGLEWYAAQTATLKRFRQLPTD